MQLLVEKSLSFDLLQTVTAFAGIRAEEVKRLDWKHVKLGKGHIEIPASISKTKLRRLAPIVANLRAWLAPHRQAQGPVCPFINLSNQDLKLAPKAGAAWKRNALRHSFVSYRV
jgi:integrase/recombinase XerD